MFLFIHLGIMTCSNFDYHIAYAMVQCLLDLSMMSPFVGGALPHDSRFAVCH